MGSVCAGPVVKVSHLQTLIDKARPHAQESDAKMIRFNQVLTAKPWRSNVHPVYGDIWQTIVCSRGRDHGQREWWTDGSLTADTIDYSYSIAMDGLTWRSLAWFLRKHPHARVALHLEYWNTLARLCGQDDLIVPPSLSRWTCMS